MSFRVLFSTLRTFKRTKEDPPRPEQVYGKLGDGGPHEMKALRLWKVGGGDESVRSICYYLDTPPPKGPPAVCDLELIDNDVTPLGCEFLGKTLGLGGNPVIVKLVLDFNRFGTEGVEKLAIGLSQNRTLRSLSMQYCGIGPEGGAHIGTILVYVWSKLEELLLRGNELAAPGTKDILIMAKRAKALKRISMAHNGIRDAGEVVEALVDLMKTRDNIAKYDFLANELSDEDCRTIIHGAMGLNHLQELRIYERIPETTMEAIASLVGGKKGKKGKKGRKK
mmetsp:Transcript_11683/g.26034  ORF Transcript_11683/g.26034 Transcript_11683/m.26034 type:complete len:280 (+) Transcript_11683:243-1082(+)